MLADGSGDGRKRKQRWSDGYSPPPPPQLRRRSLDNHAARCTRRYARTSTHVTVLHVGEGGGSKASLAPRAPTQSSAASHSPPDELRDPEDHPSGGLGAAVPVRRGGGCGQRGPRLHRHNSPPDDNLRRPAGRAADVVVAEAPRLVKVDEPVEQERDDEGHRAEVVEARLQQQQQAATDARGAGWRAAARGGTVSQAEHAPQRRSAP